MPLRIPIIRFGNDLTPIGWWEWLFYPIVFVITICFFVVASILAIPVRVISDIASLSTERKMKDRLIKSGRFVADDELKRHLDDGSGTLIVVHESPKGPIREWWTEDDVIGNAPLSLPDKFDDCLVDDLTVFAERCLEKYVDPTEGSAVLTNGVFAPGDATVAVRFPRAKIVTILAWSGPSIAQGHLGDMLRKAS